MATPPGCSSTPYTLPVPPVVLYRAQSHLWPDEHAGFSRWGQAASAMYRNLRYDVIRLHPKTAEQLATMLQWRKLASTNTGRNDNRSGKGFLLIQL